MSKTCYIIEMTVLNEFDIDSTSYRKNRSICTTIVDGMAVCKAFEKYEDAKAYLEGRPDNSSFSMKWDGKYRYFGFAKIDGWKTGLVYNILPVLID